MDLRGKLPQNGQYDRRRLVDIRFLVVHHVAVDGLVTPEAIARHHISLGWPGAGYTFYVRRDGTIYQLNDLEAMPYNVAGRNRQCLGVCLEGDFTKRKPGAVQVQATVGLLRWLQGQLPWTAIKGHGEVALPASPSACPGLAIEAVRAAM